MKTANKASFFTAAAALSLSAPFALNGVLHAASPEQPQDTASDADNAEEANEAPERNCLQVRRIRDHRVPEPGQLEFRINANDYMRVHFRQECKGLNNRSQISYRSRSSRLCKSDEIRVLASLGTSANVTDVCFVQGFSKVKSQD